MRSASTLSLATSASPGEKCKTVAVDAESLIHQYLSLSESLAKQVWRTAPHALEQDELIGIAHLGLVSAARRWTTYCAENNFDEHALQFFKPYVARRVYGALIDAIRASDWATRSLRSRAKALQDAGQERGLSEKELSERSGLTIKEVRSTIRGMSLRPVSLEAEELDPVSGRGVESEAFTNDVLGTVVGTIRDLEPEQQVVLTLHYFRGLQLQEVAREMGISESRASQLHARAVLAVHAGMVDAVQHREIQQ
jgi:RNA polymerase sigma factor for flagellar operon FliA